MFCMKLKLKPINLNKKSKNKKNLQINKKSKNKFI